MPGAPAVIGLRQLEAAEADALLLGGDGILIRGSFDLNVRDRPVGVPPAPLRQQRLVERDGFGFVQRALPLVPKLLARAAVKQDHRALVNVPLLPLPERQAALQTHGLFALFRCEIPRRQQRSDEDLLPGALRAGLQGEALAPELAARVAPEAAVSPLVPDVEREPGGKFQLAGEVQRLHRDALVCPLAVRHIQKAQEREPQLLAGGGLPDERARQRAGAQIQLPPEIAKAHPAEIQRFPVQGQLRHQPFGRGDHEMGLVHDPAVGAVELHQLVDAVGIGPAQAVHAPALVKAAAHAVALVAQREDGLADAGIARVEALLYDLPRIDREIDVSNFSHGKSSHFR